MEKLKLDDFKQYHFLSQLKYAPAGINSALIASKANDKNGYFDSIFVKKGNEAFYRLTDAEGKIDQFIWLDDTTILFSQFRCPDQKKAAESGEELTPFYKISIDGGEAERAFTIDLKVRNLLLLDENTYVLNVLYNHNYPAAASKEPHEKQKMLADFKKTKAYEIIDEAPFWSNGAGFTNKMRNRLYLYSEEKGAAAITPPLRMVEEYKITPCKKYIVYTGQDVESVASNKSAVYIYSIETGETKTLQELTYAIGHIDVWQDQLILTATQGLNHGLNENKDFYQLNLETGQMSLLKDYPLSVCTPVNSDNRKASGNVYKVYGDALYFTGLDRFYTELYKMNLSDGNIEKISHTQGSVDFFDISDKGIELVAFKDSRLQEVYTLTDGEMTRISSFNEEIHQTKIYQTPQYHNFMNKESTEIDGWVLLPVDYEKGKKYPAILNIHGGPKTAFGDIYFHEMQYWAAQGYFVLFANPTGGDGRGDQFADIRGKYGTTDYDDLMQFVDEMLISYPDIDKDRLGVTGGSYGGFMTNWIIGHTDRFKAAASQRSISNWVSFTYVSDIGYRFGVDQMQADAWGNVEKMWEHSPLKYADQAKTPTLFIHSDQDYRCWVPEALQMYTALKLHGVETRLCLFHGENHELSRSGKPENRIQRLSEITAWMDQYLK